MFAGAVVVVLVTLWLLHGVFTSSSKTLQTASSGALKARLVETRDGIDTQYRIELTEPRSGADRTRVVFERQLTVRPIMAFTSADVLTVTVNDEPTLCTVSISTGFGMTSVGHCGVGR